MPGRALPCGIAQLIFIFGDTRGRRTIPILELEGDKAK